MRRVAIVAAFVVLATGAIALAATALNLRGSDTLQKLTLDLVTTTANPGTPLCAGIDGGINYVGTGSSQGENAMLAGSQGVAPMSRFLGSAACAAAGDAGAPSTAEGLVVGLDGIRIVAAQTATGTACNGATADCDPTTDPTAGVAFNTTITITGGTYTFNGWRDVLRVLFAGFDHNNAGTGPANLAARDCNSAVRVALASSYGAFFENNCTAQAGDSTGGVCTQIRHIFRPDDFSGTTDTIVSLLGLPSIVPPETNVTVFPGGASTTIKQHTGSSPFCNAVRPAFALPQSSAGRCTNGSACTVGGAACADASTCVATQPQVTCLQGSDATWDPTQKNLGAGCTKENAVYRSTMQDNDPIRRTCFGSGAGAVGTLGEDNCSHSGDLGLLLVMNDVPETGDVGTTSDSLRYNATPCLRGRFSSATPPEVWDAVTQGRQVCTRGLLCPNGDFCNNAGGCIVPSDATGNTTCLANKLTAPPLPSNSVAVPARPRRMDRTLWPAGPWTSAIWRGPTT